MQFGDAHSQPKQQLKIGSLQIAEGKEGIRQTLTVMSSLVKRYKTHPAVLLKAREIVGNLMQKDYYGEIRALTRWVRDNIRYVPDPTDVQTVTTPDKLLELRQGNCANKSVLLAAMLEALGKPTRFVAVGFKPNDWVHVFVQAKAGRGWVNLETTEPVEPGWGPPNAQQVMVINN